MTARRPLAARGHLHIVFALLLFIALASPSQSGKPECGNDIREGSEECDGISNNNCNGNDCKDDCTCEGPGSTPGPTPAPGPATCPLSPTDDYPPFSDPAYSMPIYGVWHCGNHYCDWSVPRSYDEFDEANRWIIDRNHNSPSSTCNASVPLTCNPSVNLVILSFLQPMQVLIMDQDHPTSGVPVYMETWIVEYFKNQGVRVMMSIGGITYTDFWDEALSINGTLFGTNAALIAKHFGVGIEIDYERATDPNLDALDDFVAAYRSKFPYDPTGENHAARLTIDLAAGNRYLQSLSRHATTYWLDSDSPVLDYANAMVHRSSGTPLNWQEHIDGKPQYNPEIPGKAANMFTGGLYVKGNTNNCDDFYGSEQYEHYGYVRCTGMLGLMFWAAEYPSARNNYVATVPPNTCEDGMGVAATEFNISIPMAQLRP